MNLVSARGDESGQRFRSGSCLANNALIQAIRPGIRLELGAADTAISGV